VLNRYFKDPSTLTKYQHGPAGPYLDSFIGWFEARDYRYRSIRCHIRGADHFSRWGERAELACWQLDTSALEAFGKHLQKRSLLTYANGRLNQDFIGARYFVAFLQSIGDSATSASLPPAEPELLTAFRRWMRTQRGTMDVTLNNYRLVIVDLLHSLGEQPEQYNAEVLRTFVLDRTSRYGTGKAKLSRSKFHNKGGAGAAMFEMRP
jgi:hypothetical protein